VAFNLSTIWIEIMRTKVIACLSLVVLAGNLCATDFHVATKGHDNGRGTKSAPLRTIQRAAELAQPGDTITVHQGVYRESINPPRGGTSDRNRIVYQAARGEKVEIKGSEVIRGWSKVEGDVWKTTIPNSFFGKFNPYSDLIRGDWFDRRGRDHHTGAVYLNGEWLIEAAKLEEVMMPAGTAPSWLTQAGQQYLVNVAWLRAGDGSGAAGRVPATRFNSKHGTQNAACAEGGDCVGFILAGDWVRYEQFDFGLRTETLELRAAAESEGGIVEIRLGGPEGELLGTCSVPNTGGWQKWSTFKAKIKPVSGLKTLCLAFKSHQPLELPSESRLWFAQVDATNTVIWAQFNGVDPNQQLVEINVRRTVFYPDQPGRNFITVRGFTLEHAATPWAPPTAEQMGLIGTHWSKGWIIEQNRIRYSRCSGVALGKYGDEWDNRAESAEGYVGTINRALQNGWSRDNIGHHVVRNNHISHCEQTGVVGSLGCAFSTVTGNIIHDIHVRKLFSGAEMAGIKFHGAIDVEISHNHIYRTTLGIWLDWMAQGSRITGNLMHDNHQFDLFHEVDHGPFLVDNNILLSRQSQLIVSQGGAFAHNLIGGGLTMIPFDARLTPFHRAHSTELGGLTNNPSGDVRYYNNLFVQRGDVSPYDKATLPLSMAGNVFLRGTKPSRYETAPLLHLEFDPQIKLLEKPDGFYLDCTFYKSWGAEQPRKLVTSALLGIAQLPKLPFENPDGSPLRLDTDYFGKKRNVENPFPGPFNAPAKQQQLLKVWPLPSR